MAICTIFEEFWNPLLCQIENFYFMPLIAIPKRKKKQENLMNPMYYNHQKSH